MSGDYSRDRFNPRKDLLALLQQQGRVQHDADANELVNIIDRRFRAQTVDTIGRCTVPRETPDGFLIKLAERTLTIGRGRIYVDGLLAENHGKGGPEFDAVLAAERGTEDINYTEQPYFHSADTTPPLPDGAGPHLVYIVAWQRELTALQAPELIEPAIGQDTVTALQTAWQVRVLPNIETDQCGGEIREWNLLVRPSDGRLSTFHVEAPAEEDPCIIAGGAGGYTGLENQLYRVEIHKGGPIGEATFKWSRENASIEAGVLEIADRQLTVTRVGRDAVLRLRPGDWVEITDDVRELDARPGELRRVTNVDDATRVIEIDAPLPAADFPTDTDGTPQPQRHTRIRRWDQQGDALEATHGEIPVPAAGEKIDLEKGIQIAFDTATPDGRFKSGDYWTFAARVADASVEKLVKAAPRGIHRHYGRLAVIQFPDQVTDCRVLWPPLQQSPPVPEQDRGIPIKRVQLSATQDELPNDREVPAPLLARGIQILLGDVLDERSLAKRPTCYVTIDLPYPLNDADRQLWAGLPAFGYQPIVLDGRVQLVQGSVILWSPTDPVIRLLSGQLFNTLRNRHIADPVLARLHLKGNFLWGRQEGEQRPIYVDGDAFADPRSGGIIYPTGDDRRGGNFDMWFWLVPG